jgi:hypothetical protein
MNASNQASRGEATTSALSTRRRFLTTVAGASVISVGSLAASTIRERPPVSCLAVPAVPSDPAFALIADKRAADIVHGEAIDAQDEAEDRYGFRSDEASEAYDRCGVACQAVNAIDWRLATTPPMTLTGIAAVLRFANEHEDAGGEWPSTDAIGTDGWHYQLRATMAAAIEALIHPGKAVIS